MPLSLIRTFSPTFSGAVRKAVSAARLAGLFPLLALLEGFQLLVQILLPVALVLQLLVGQGAQKLRQLAAGVLGGLFLRLGLLDGADGAFHLLVGPLDNFLGLLLRLVQDFLAELLDVLQLLLVAVRHGFQGLVGRADLRQFLVQDPAVPGDLPQVPLDAHELLAGAELGVLDNRFGQAHLAGELEGEGVAGQAHFQREERRNLLRVELHRAVHDARIARRGVQLQVRIVRGDDPVHAAAVQVR